MIDENMPHSTEMKIAGHEQEARDSRILRTVASARQLLVRLRSSVSSEPVNLREISINPDNALKNTLEVNIKAEPSLRELARLVNFLKDNAKGERNRNVAEADKTDKMLLKVAFIVALTRVLIDKITNNIVSNVKVEAQPKEKGGKLRTLLNASVSASMLGTMSLGAIGEIVTSQDVEAALRNEGETPQTFNIDQDGLESANSFDEVEAKCREIEVLMANLQVQIPELNTSMASINIPDGIDGQGFRNDVEAEFARICADLGLDGSGGISELIVAEEGDEEAPPPPEDPREEGLSAASIDMLLALGELEQGEELSLVFDRDFVRIFQTPKFNEVFGGNRSADAETARNFVENAALFDEEVFQRGIVTIIVKKINDSVGTNHPVPDIHNETEMSAFYDLLDQYGDLTIQAYTYQRVDGGSSMRTTTLEDFYNNGIPVVRMGRGFLDSRISTANDRLNVEPLIDEETGEIIVYNYRHNVGQNGEGPAVFVDIGPNDYEDVHTIFATIISTNGLSDISREDDAYIFGPHVNINN